jgi:predicted lysophospholipase L1 biosynthesis ABC-type transport system permease subunit
VGRTIRLEREPWIIVGVAAGGFEHPGGEYRSPLQGETVDRSGVAARRRQNARTARIRGNGGAAIRFLLLFQAFAGQALVLAAAGIYGLLAYIVQQRRKELSIRVALGASRGNLCCMVLSDGLRMAASGAMCCLLLIPLCGYSLRVFLFHVQAFDVFTIAGAPAALLIAALLASLGPAWNAMRSDPAQALREE